MFFEINWGLGILKNNNLISNEYTFNIEEINNLEADFGTENIKIINEGNEFKVVEKNVIQEYKCEVDDSTLVIDSKSKKYKLNINNDSEIRIYVPKDFVFNSVNLNLGTGDNDIDILNTDNLDLVCGTGQLNINYLQVNEKANITCGVGKFKIANSKITNLNLKAGVGENSIKSELLGESNIELGVGKTNVKLENFSEDTGKIEIKKGMGKLNVNEKEYSNNYNFGNGKDTIINIVGGIGEINLEY
jgi:hypothetical protein